MWKIGHFDFRCVALLSDLGTSGMNSQLSVETDTLFKAACLQNFSWKVLRLTVFAEKLAGITTEIYLKTDSKTTQLFRF